MAFGDVKFEYREYKRICMGSPEACIAEPIKNTVPGSTAECERGYSKMNIVCSSLRSRLTVPHISSLTFEWDNDWTMESNAICKVMVSFQSQVSNIYSRSFFMQTNLFRHSHCYQIAVESMLDEVKWVICLLLSYSLVLIYFNRHSFSFYLYLVWYFEFYNE